MLIFIPHLIVDDGRVVRFYLARVKRADGFDVGSPRPSTSPSTCSRSASSRCPWGLVNRRARRMRTLLLLVSTLVIAAGRSRWRTNALQRLDYASVNKRFAIRGPQAPPKDVVIVAVDDDSFGASTPAAAHRAATTRA